MYLSALSLSFNVDVWYNKNKIVEINVYEHNKQNIELFHQGLTYIEILWLTDCFVKMVLRYLCIELKWCFISYFSLV